MMRPVPGIPIEQQPEGVVLRMAGWAEARGEIRKGLLAVLWVIRNRALHADTSLKAEILKPWQFSSFNQADPNRDKMLRAWTDDSLAWAAVDAVCELFEAGSTEDPTDGARHYYVEKMPDPPKWGRGHPGWMEHCVIGRQVFGIAA